MVRPSISLLIFNRGDPTEALELVRQLSDRFDEVVVIDSSAHEGWEALLRGLRAPKERAVRVIPTGYTDLLLPFGVGEITSEWVFYCDPDEEPSSDLLRRFQHLELADGFVVRRWERTLNAYTSHLRLFRRRCFFAPNPAYAFPEIRGTLSKLPRNERIVHHRDFRSDVEGYLARYMDLESFERPVDRFWFRDVLGARPGASGAGARTATTPSPPLPLSGPAAALAALLSALRELLRSGSPAWARFQWTYHRARAQFMGALPSEERTRRAEITFAARRAGGLIRYLGFDDPGYVRRLSQGFTWDVEGNAVLHRLIDYRFAHGIPMPSWKPIPNPS
ncbi:MAG: glycosyltransferase family 2 protein [Thermoplasmata archaeon]|nr:glycosyltransferase family 2 protein [Thermoplasmata archaeon]